MGTNSGDEIKWFSDFSNPHTFNFTINNPCERQSKAKA